MPYELIDYPVVCSCLVAVKERVFSSSAEPQKSLGTFNWSKNLTKR